jgi:hypothetical protein
VLVLELNDTKQEYNQTTDNNGNFTWIEPLLPQANDSATACNVVASFGGDSASTATATLTTLNGTTAVCMTERESKN